MPSRSVRQRSTPVARGMARLEHPAVAVDELDAVVSLGVMRGLAPVGGREVCN